MESDGVFSGGGIKGLAFAGALTATAEAGYDNWVNLAGTSAGAIVAMALATGYKADDVKRVLSAEDFSKLADYGHFGPLSQAINLIKRKSIAKGEALHNWINDLLIQAPEPATQFGELKRNLKVIGTDLAHSRMVVFPDDVGLYQDAQGKAFVPSEFSIAEAVRISASFPFFFPPVGSLYDRQTGQQGMFCDGGVTSQLPVFLFDVPKPARPTWGFNLFEGFDVKHAYAEDISGFIWPDRMGKAVLKSSMNALDFFEMAHFGDRIIAIPTGDIPILDFALSPAQQSFLWQSGYDSAKAFFAKHPQGANRFGVTA